MECINKLGASGLIDAVHIEGLPLWGPTTVLSSDLAKLVLAYFNACAKRIADVLLDKLNRTGEYIDINVGVGVFRVAVNARRFTSLCSVKTSIVFSIAFPADEDSLSMYNEFVFFRSEGEQHRMLGEHQNETSGPVHLDVSSWDALSRREFLRREVLVLSKEVRDLYVREFC